MSATSTTTSPSRADLPTPADVERAHAAAARAAAEAGVNIRLAHDVVDLDAARATIDAVWRPQPDNPPVTRGMLRALTHAGSYCGVALDGGVVVGASVGFLGLHGTGAAREGLGHVPPPVPLVHSHITGTVPETSGRHVGRALKLHQRAWALEHGITTITWTYDPLVRRNAYFNITKLGARATAYLNDFYGDMTDGLNVGQGSDRLVATWTLLDPVVVAAADGVVAAPPVAGLMQAGGRVVLEDDDDSPVVLADGQGGVRERVLARVPADIERLRTRSPALASAWREAVRASVGDRMRAGWEVTAFSRSGYYELTPTATPATGAP
ncbi:GNAT family N-acetyltransferase [Nocardioides sp. cx-173]|uniref:GNAT family N-acetyltransferase n=1 Tax=Nocardioides sp. cx-173 TaxID=2898796 RepID=UPI001E2CF826|nr:GNAT family N-acetyltransferase [Nocardioides sp. cx-173]MCD4524520.1 GNAT family N-acetyltransferase [Nocardioides sp. cx-173]UGB42995.1 GNAT family N-acetyltransferase [Nocardioides sp. cx-173]